MVFRVVALALFVLSVYGTGAPVHAQSGGARPPLDAVIAQFVEVAFGHEHGPSRDIIQKWSRAPSIALFARPEFDAGPHLTRLRGVLRAIDGLTGLSVMPAGAARPATLRFGFYPRSEFRKLPIAAKSEEVQTFLSTSACVAIALGNPQRPGEIAGGLVVIGTDIDEPLRRHCIVEEMIQVLGLPNDACAYRPSLFCERDFVLRLTAADRILLATLYDDRLPIGMSRVEAMPMIRRVIAEFYASASFQGKPGRVEPRRRELKDRS